MHAHICYKMYAVSLFYGSVLVVFLLVLHGYFCLKTEIIVKGEQFFSFEYIKCCREIRYCVFINDMYHLYCLLQFGSYLGMMGVILFQWS